MTVDKPTPGNLIATVSELVDAENAGSGNALIAATPFTTTTMTNPISGGDMTVIVVPVDNPVLAIALEGDTFPRILINADPTDFEGIAMGDGTINPATSGVAFGYNPGGNLIISTPLSNLQLRSAGAELNSFGGDMTLNAGADGIRLVSSKLGFFTSSAVPQPTGVPITAAGIHAALVALGLITA